jgi:hypothetical protein
MAKVQFNKKKSFFHLQNLGYVFTEENSKVLHLEKDLYGAETWILRKMDQM